MDDTFSGSDFEAAASATVSPDTAAVETAAADSTTPGGETTPEASAAIAPVAAPAATEKPKGPIPFDAHSKALENARTKARDEALTEWRSRYGWVEQTPAEAMAEMQRFAQLYQNDRPALIRNLITEALSDAALGDLTASELGRALSSRRGTAAHADAREPEPDVQITDANGQVVGTTYSAQQLAKRDAWREAQWDAKMRQSLQPYESIRQRIEAAERQRSDEARIDSQLQEASQWPGFLDHQEAIAQALAQPNMTLERAYITAVVPRLATSERTKVLSELTQKPAATTVSPSGGTPHVGKADADKSWEDLFAEMSAKLGV